MLEVWASCGRAPIEISKLENAISFTQAARGGYRSGDQRVEADFN
jgi:hypothetical protein